MMNRTLRLISLQLVLNGGPGSGNPNPGQGRGKGKPAGGSSSLSLIQTMNYDSLIEAYEPSEQQKIATSLSNQALQDIESKHPELINREKQEENLRRNYEEYEKFKDVKDRVHNLSYEDFKKKVLSREISPDGVKRKTFEPIFELAMYGAGASPFLEGLVMYAYGANTYHLDRKEFDEKHKLSETIDKNKDLWTNYNKPLYRGISTNDEGLQQLKKGATISMNGLSSWSSEKSIANRFTRSGLIKTGSNPVIFVDKSKSHSKTLFYPYSSSQWTGIQCEYVQSGSKQYRINDIHKEGGVYYADVESY